MMKNTLSKFSKNYFWDGDEHVMSFVEKEISLFKTRFPEIESTILKKLISCFPDKNVENWTQFFNNDRCLRYLIQIDEEERFVLQVSIFNAISIYKHSYKSIDGLFEYAPVKFLNKGDSSYADQIYNCVSNQLTSFEWIDKTQLEILIPEFSIEDDLFPGLMEIKVADVLFTKDRL